MRRGSVGGGFIGVWIRLFCCCWVRRGGSLIDWGRFGWCGAVTVGVDG